VAKLLGGEVSSFFFGGGTYSKQRSLDWTLGE